MWIKTRNGRLVDTTGSTIESVDEKGESATHAVQVVPHGGKPVVVAGDLSSEQAKTVLADLEIAIASHMTLVEI